MPSAPSRPRLRRRLAAVLTAVVVVLGLAGPLPTAFAATGTGVITGRLMQDGAAVANACVETFHADGTSGGYSFTATDDAGRYTTDQLPAATYQVRFSRCGATQPFAKIYYLDSYDAAGATPVTVTAGGTTTADMVLPATGDIQGTVTNDLGQPLAGICVRAIDFFTALPSVQVSTDTDGHYVLGPLAESAWYVAFLDCDDPATGQPHGVAGEYYDNTPDFASARFLEVPRGAHLTGVNGSLDRLGSISGHLTLPGGSTQPRCVRAQDTGGHSPTLGSVAADGTWAVEGLGVGDYVVRFDYCDNTYYQTEWYDNRQSFSSGTTVHVSAGADTPGIDAQLARPGTIAGRVLGPAGTPIAAACVDLYQGAQYVGVGTATESDGTYSLGGLVEGQFSVHYTDCGQRGLGSEWWDDKPTRASSDPVSVAADRTTTLHDVQLVVDSTPPDTVITSGPAEGAVATFPITFGFTSVPGDESDTFECLYDRDTTWRECTSPMDYNTLSPTNTFQVRAIDDVGNVDPTPATRTFTSVIDLPPVTGGGAAPAGPSAACVAATAVVRTAQALVGSTASSSSSAAAALSSAGKAVKKAKAALKKAPGAKKAAAKKKVKAALARQAKAAAAATSARNDAASASRQLQAAQAQVGRAC